MTGDAPAQHMAHRIIGEFAGGEWAVAHLQNVDFRITAAKPQARDGVRGFPCIWILGNSAVPVQRFAIRTSDTTARRSGATSCWQRLT
jgi:hypothetical protein